MKRAIVVTVLVALVVIFVAVVVDCGGQASGPRRPAPETQRDAPAKGAGGFQQGSQTPPPSSPSTDE